MDTRLEFMLIVIHLEHFFLFLSHLIFLNQMSNMAPGGRRGKTSKGGGNKVRPDLTEMMNLSPGQLRAEQYGVCNRLAKINLLGKVVVAGVIVAFNIVFWIVAVKEYTKPYQKMIE